jgi:predicted nucleotidyltransferase
MIELRNYKKHIRNICSVLAVQRLELVGSAARDDFQPDKSDIDVLVDFKGNERLFERYFDLKEQLEKCFGRRVDIIQSNALKNPYVKQSIDCDRITIYES